jgi:bifunctional DNA-binding transcriptional regulator/antitoxin component of YhaV-PrlF toxin-antitoxin module
VAQSRLTSKYQTTVPSGVRLALGARPGDTLAWNVREGQAIVSVASGRFLAWRGRVPARKVGAVEAVRIARSMRGGKGRPNR